MAPALAGDGPNPEYPWPKPAPLFTPTDHDFNVWLEIEKPTAGRQFLSLIERLFEFAETFF